MALPTLEEIKKYINVDFDDNDSTIEMLLLGAVARATNITGLDLSDVNNQSADINQAIIEDVNNKYSGNVAKEFDEPIIAVYRQHSRSPMFSNKPTKK